MTRSVLWLSAGILTAMLAFPGGTLFAQSKDGCARPPKEGQGPAKATDPQRKDDASRAKTPKADQSPTDTHKGDPSRVDAHKGDRSGVDAHKGLPPKPSTKEGAESSSQTKKPGTVAEQQSKGVDTKQQKPDQTKRQKAPSPDCP